MLSHPTSQPLRPGLGPRLAGVVAVGTVALVLGLGSPAAGLGQPVDPRDPSTTSTTEAKPSTTDDTTSTTVEAGEDPDPVTTEAPAVTPAGTAADDEDGGFGGLALVAVGLVAFVLGLLVAGLPLAAALSRRKAKHTGPSASAPPVSAPPAASSPSPPVAPSAPGGPVIGAPPSRDVDQVRQQRVTLVQSLIRLRDQLTSEAQTAEVGQALAAVGVTELNPLGHPFDPAQHRAVDRVITEDPHAHGRITSVERPGYADGEQIVRQPEVVVAQHGSGS